MESNAIYRDLEKTFSLFRWVLICIAPIMIGLSEFSLHNFYFYIALLFGCFYNILLTYAAYNKNHRFQPILKFTMYLDVPFISFLIFIRGGLRSDMYLLYYLVILYDGAKFGIKGTIHSLAQSIFFFTIATFFFTAEKDFDINRFIIKVIYLVTTTFVMYHVNRQINAIREREKQARDLAQRDPLTKLSNRLLLSDRFEEMRKYSEETEHPFAVMIFDIDNFKRINDTYGHTFGDTALVTIADILKKYISSSNFLCRFGGEEFLAFLKETNKHDARNIANKIREEVANYDFDGVKITISIGINIFNKNYTMIENITFADEAMYTVKNEGKNKVYIYEPLVN